VSSELWSGFRLGDRWVRPDVNKIDETRIDAKAMEVLVALAEVSPAVMSGSALLERVWPNVVVVDNVVYQAIAQLRKALGDTARSPRYIECISRRGYRLIASIGPEMNGASARPETGHNLPEELTRFIGRERELGELIELLKCRRMITLTGVGGCGKTRLAFSVARACASTFPDGVCLVDLGPVTDASHVLHAVAKALHVQESSGQSVHESVIASLHNARTLLVLDNCEHVIDACARLAETLLTQAKELHILATSREAVGIGAEQLFPVQPLSIPERDEASSIERLAAVDSVQLFIDRAKAVRRDFGLTSANAGAVAEICVRLDGLPFAIELAAARTRDMSPDQIQDALRDRFRLLAGGSRTALPRHRTLQATLDWSYQLLLEHHRVLLRRISTFPGDFSIEAAAALSAEDEPEPVFDGLTRLVDQSMIQVDPATGRYRMLETVRQYATDRLIESGEACLIRDRHRTYSVELSEELLRDLKAGRWHSGVFSRFLLEQYNFEAALAWCLDNDISAGLRLAANLWWFWPRLNMFSSMHWFEDLLARAPNSFPERSETLRLAASFHVMQDPRRAIQYLEEALQLARTQRNGPVWSEGAALLVLARARLQNGESERTAAIVEQALVLAGADPQIRAEFLVESADILMWSEFENATLMASEAVELFRRQSKWEPLSRALTQAAFLKIISGEFSLARSMLEEAVSLSHITKNHVQARRALYHIAILDEIAGENAAALRFMEMYEKSFVGLDLNRDSARAQLGRLLCKSGQQERGVEMLRGVLLSVRPERSFLCKLVSFASLHGLVVAACDLGDYMRAARLYGAARKIRGNVVPPVNKLFVCLFESVIPVMRTALGGEIYEAAINEGASLTYQQVVHYAHEGSRQSNSRAGSTRSLRASNGTRYQPLSQ